MAVVNQKRPLLLGTYELKELDDNYKASTENLNRLKHGGRIIGSPFLLRRIMSVSAGELPSPIIVKLINTKSAVELYSGIQGFDGKKDEILAPKWICDHFAKKTEKIDLKVYLLRSGLSRGKLAKFKPLSADFLSVMNPKKALETALANYTCLNVNNTIDIFFTNKVYKMRITKLEPDGPVDVTNCDLVVEFEAPPETPEVDNESNSSEFTPFSGRSRRLDSKEIIENQQKPRKGVKRGVPDYSYKLGTMKRIIPKPAPADLWYNKLKSIADANGRITLRKIKTK